MHMPVLLEPIAQVPVAQPALEIETPLAASQALIADEPASSPVEMMSAPTHEAAPETVAEVTIAIPAQSSATIAKTAPPAAKHASVGRMSVAQAATRRRATPLIAERRFPPTISSLESPKPRLTTTVLLVAGIAIGFAAVALSGFDAAIVAPVIAPPAPPSDMAGIDSQTTAAQSAENARPVAVANDAADRPSQNVERKAAPASRPEAGIDNAIQHNGATQNPANTQPRNRPQLALALPRPRATTPAAPTVAVPEISIAPSLPAPLLDMPILEGRTPELPQPVQPQAGPDYRPPQVLARAEPVYSTFARQARLQGTVKVNATIGTDGVPRSLVCVDGNSVLCRMAFEAIAKWRYRPAMSNGQPVEAQTLISFNFQLR
jgi:TonB family protein